MFTGIVEEQGSVVELHRSGDRGRISVRGPLVAADARPGNSIAVNGVCLSVVSVADGVFAADVMGETLDRSGLGSLSPGDPVNLERAATPQTRLGGHLVQGHVDATGTVAHRHQGSNWETMTVSLPARLAAYVAEKGSIAVDGVSLTVIDVGPQSFSVGLIPTTLTHTTLGSRRVGDLVNLEVDVVAKYVARLLTAREAGDGGPAPGVSEPVRADVGSGPGMERG